MIKIFWQIFIVTIIRAHCVSRAATKCKMMLSHVEFESKMSSPALSWRDRKEMTRATGIFCMRDASESNVSCGIASRCHIAIPVNYKTVSAVGNEQHVATRSSTRVLQKLRVHAHPWSNSGIRKRARVLPKYLSCIKCKVRSEITVKRVLIGKFIV